MKNAITPKTSQTILKLVFCSFIPDFSQKVLSFFLSSFAMSCLPPPPPASSTKFMFCFQRTACILKFEEKEEGKNCKKLFPRRFRVILRDVLVTSEITLAERAMLFPAQVAVKARRLENEGEKHGPKKESLWNTSGDLLIRLLTG